MFCKILKLSHDHISARLSKQPSTSNISKRAPESWLCTLPTELLEIIFSYLTPRDLVTVRELGIQRLTEISLAFKSADFSLCNTVLTADVSSFFTRDRVEYIREINFNNVFFVKSSILEKYIIKCKHLTVLSVFECGLSYSNILCILGHCDKLEELYWSVWEKKISPYYFNPDETTLNIKKLYLSIKDSKPGSFRIICDILERCLSAQDVCLNFSPYFTTSLPPSVSRMTFTGKLKRITNCPVSIVISSELPYCGIEAKSVMIELSSVRNLTIDGALEDDEEDLSFFLTNHSSYLQFLTEEKELSAIPFLPDNSVNSMVLIMTDLKELLLKYMERIKQMTAKSLRHLTIHNTSRPLTLIDGEELIEASGGEFICDIITQMTSTCLNIQVLNLSELHFDVPFSFPALYCLKQLKTLSLSACTLKEPAFTHDTAVHPQIIGFEGMVQNCTNIERFTYLGCLWCQFGPTDDAVISMAGWKNLTHLTLSKVDTFRTCRFLGHVANSCHHLTSLELIEIGELAVCHYIPNVIQVLRKSKKLTFLRINQKAFHPGNSLFWKSIELARNLQGLCLVTGIDTAIDNKMITDPLRKLPFLHLFHITAKRICQNLPTQIKQIMTSNDVQTQNIETEIYREPDYFYLECKHSHFPVF